MPSSSSPSSSLTSSSSSFTSSAPPPAPFTLSAEALGDVDELDAGRETTWLQPFQRSWEDIEEDAAGLLVSSTLALQKARKAAIPVDPGLIISKGVIRCLVLVLDFSSSMALTDLKPSRRLLTLALLTSFVSDFFDQNPLSQLSFVLGHRGVALKVTELSGHPQEQIRRLKDKCEAILIEEEKAQRTGGGGAAAAAAGAASGGGAGGGSFSLQNCLEMARSTLSGVPSYASREVLCIQSSLSTVDASDIQTTIASLQAQRCTANVIHLAAELRVCHHTATSTGGRHAVVLNKDHYAQLLRSFLPPTPSSSTSQASAATRRWMRMGFPKLTTTAHPLLCTCHAHLTHTAYSCPHCTSRYCELPTQCSVCSLQLVSSPQLARTYHHLFPSPHYSQAEEGAGERREGRRVQCRGCLTELVEGADLLTTCDECGDAFCIDCDEWVHTVLHHCPGCQSRLRSKVEEEQAKLGVRGRALLQTQLKAEKRAIQASSAATGAAERMKAEPMVIEVD